MPSLAPAASAEPGAPPPEARSTVPGRRVVGAVGAFGSISSGLVATPSVGVGLWEEAQLGRWSFGLAERVIPRSTVALAEVGTGSFTYFGGLLQGCGTFVQDRSVAVGACALVEGGGLIGRGSGVANPRHALRGWAGLGGGPQIVARVTSRVFFTWRGALVASLVRPRFELDGWELYRPAVATGTLYAGLGVRTF